MTRYPERATNQTMKPEDMELAWNQSDYNECARACRKAGIDEDVGCQPWRRVASDLQAMILEVWNRRND